MATIDSSETSLEERPEFTVMIDVGRDGVIGC